MKNISWKNLLPHLIAVIIFLVVAAVYCKPALQGKVMPQHDLAQWVGMSKDQLNYRDKNGHPPLWTNGMFSGMPGYVIAGYTNNALPAHFINILSLYLPEPLNFFFLACICFYFLSQVLRIRPWIGIIGALLYAYATYNPIIITVGHVTKMLSIALMPGLVGSLLLLFNKKYWFGTALTTFFTAALVAENHYQIVYYTGLIALFMGISFLITCIKAKDFKHLAIVVIAGLFAGAVGLATNAVMLLPNAEYAKETIRGGSQLGASSDPTQQGSSGLNEDYAFSYSMLVSEPFVMMVPRMFGGGSGRAEVKQEESKAIAALQSMPQELGQQLVRNLSYYWGGIGNTSGPPYVGAIVCFLAILGFVIVDKKYRWWILSCCAVTIVMSWGGYFKEVNRLLLEYLPMYDKFRAPSMIIVVPTLLLGLMATLALDKILYHVKDAGAMLKPYKTALLITAGVFAVLFMMYISFDYQSPEDKEVLKNVSAIQDEQIKALVREFFTGLQEDRKGLFFNDILRSLFFIAVAAGTLWFYLKNKLKPVVATVIIGLFSFIDVMAIDVKYMSSDDFVTKEDYDNGFIPTAADNQILQDKSFYRVLDLTQGGVHGAFNAGAHTAYFHHSIGGYHPAKLSIYQDLIDSQLYRFPNCLPVLNMLNTKYIISQQGQAQQNPMAAGNAWFVKNVQFEHDSRSVMKALDNFNPLETAIAEDTVKSILRNPASFDSTATIQMISNHNDTVTYKSKSSSEQLAVFSEVYYDKGWNAYIDGKQSPYAKVNYVLRGMMVPAGEHTIEYRFEPASHIAGWKITSAAAIIMSIMLLVAIFFEIKNRRQTLPSSKQA